MGVGRLMKPAWRAWLAGAVFLALVIGGLVITRRPAPPSPAEAAASPSAAAPQAVALPQPPPPLGRAELIDAADLAASQHAAGEPAPSTVLAGRRFAMNLPFGCEGAAVDLAAQPNGWTLDEQRNTLRVKVTPEVLTESPVLRAVEGSAQIEAAEGFWIDRPWTRTENCPPAVTAGAEMTPDRQSLALVELFGPGSKRSHRRGERGYEAVQAIEPGKIDLRAGLRLRVEGRLAAIGDGPPIGCWSESPQQRPTCLISARFERIAITDATGDRVFAEWTD
jgi:hypothetical protein